MLSPESESCIRGEKLDDGSYIFSSSVYIDEFGFRTGKDRKDVATLNRTIMTVGDSFTFGYGVEYEESFSGVLNARPAFSALMAASPAYSGAQALLLARRWIAKVDPQFKGAYLVHHYRGDDISDDLRTLATKAGACVLYAGTLSGSPFCLPEVWQPVLPTPGKIFLIHESCRGPRANFECACGLARSQ